MNNNNDIVPVVLFPVEPLLHYLLLVYQDISGWNTAVPCAPLLQPTHVSHQTYSVVQISIRGCIIVVHSYGNHCIAFNFVWQLWHSPWAYFNLLLLLFNFHQYSFHWCQFFLQLYYLNLKRLYPRRVHSKMELSSLYMYSTVFTLAPSFCIHLLYIAAVAQFQ